MFSRKLLNVFPKTSKCFLRISVLLRLAIKSKVTTTLSGHGCHFILFLYVRLASFWVCQVYNSLSKNSAFGSAWLGAGLRVAPC